MAQSAGVIETPLPTLTIKVRMPRFYGWRMWAVTALLSFAGWIGPHDIEIEVVPKA